MKKTMKKIMKFNLNLLALIALILSGSAQAGTITIIGSGASSGPIFVTTALGNIDIGTRVRVGTFLDATVLNNSVSDYLSGSKNYSQTLLALNNNFSDLGTNVTNYGNSSQSAVGGAVFTPSSSQFGFNNTTTLTINGVSGRGNLFNGAIQNVNYSSSIGASKSLYIWTTFNNAIGIVRNADGSGTSAWTTPTSDLSGVTMNLSGINSQSEVLLGTYVNYATGSDLIALAVPEPSTGILLIAGSAFLLGLRRKSKI